MTMMLFKIEQGSLITEFKFIQSYEKNTTVDLLHGNSVLVPGILHGKFVCYDKSTEHKVRYYLYGDEVSADDFKKHQLIGQLAGLEQL